MPYAGAVTAAGPPRSLVSGALLDALLTLSPDACVVVDSTGTIRALNALAASMFGYQPDELAGQPIEALVPQRLHAIHKTDRDGYLAHPRTRPMGAGLELLGVRKDGSEFPVDISLAPINGEDGAAEKVVVAAVRDVTESRQHERNAARLAAVVHASDAAILSTTTDGIIDSCNPAAERMFGYTEAELIGQPISRLVPDGSVAEVDESYRRIAAGERVDTLDTTRVRKDGSTFPVATTISGMRDSGNALVGYCEVIRDHTERVRVNAALAAAQAERQVLSDRERIARDLHDLVIQRIFAAGMGLQGLASLATAEPMRDRLTRIINELDTAAQEIRGSIFTIRRTAEDADSLRGKLLDVGDTLTDALGFAPTFAFRGAIDILTSIELGDQVVAVVREALSNVAKHAKASSAHVVVSGVGDQLDVIVSDDGIGITDTDRRSGLANLARRAKELDGIFEIDTGHGLGTTLRWSVPLG